MEIYESINFIHENIENDLKEGKYDKIHTRFPPEPNGYLHIGHAKAILINYLTAKKYNGKFNLRFDDTNPAKEDIEYVNSIIEDIKWLGCDWEDRLFYAADYFDKFYEYALMLIKKGKAYVDDLTAVEIKEYRGNLTEPGKNSTYRDRDIEVNLELFKKMKNGEFADGSRVLRAKIDMSSPNLCLRDPVLYRILTANHYRTGDNWRIYPMYDYAHPLEDAIEEISHSLCSLEFENNRPLYDWVLKECEIEKPSRQIEFARLNITNTVMSKRKLLKLVEEKHVSGWDDPRMPTLSGLRRRGYTPEAIRNFIEKVGVAKVYSTVDVALLEFCIRDDLNKKANRVLSVLNPLKVTITNYPDNLEEIFIGENNPEDETAGSREIPFSKVIYIEKEDFMENANRKYNRLTENREVRLKFAYFIKCNEVIKDNNGEIIELKCTYDPDTRGGSAPDGRKVKGTIHWVSEKHAINAEIRLYDRLFNNENPEKAEEGKTFLDNINEESLKIINNAKVEPSLLNSVPFENYQFLRLGYYVVDKDSTKDNLIFNRTTTLRDSWAKISKE